MTKRKISWKEWVYYVSCAALFVYALWVISTLRGDVRPGKWLRISGVLCQRSARVVGHWGMVAERKYYEVLERERMI